MNLKKYRNKLVGSEEERAVSPVIGVILMVAITVILAAVIAAFVLDMGDSIDEEATGAATMSFDEAGEDGVMNIELTSTGNSDSFQVRGDVFNATDNDPEYTQAHADHDGNEDLILSGAGSTLSLECEDLEGEDDEPLGLEQHEDNEGTGTVTVVASNDDGDSWTNIASQDWDCTE